MHSTYLWINNYLALHCFWDGEVWAEEAEEAEEAREKGRGVILEFIPCNEISSRPPATPIILVIRRLLLDKYYRLLKQASENILLLFLAEHLSPRLNRSRVQNQQRHKV